MEEQPEPVQHVITEEEVGEYKEQDRYLPVCLNIPPRVLRSYQKALPPSSSS